MFGRNRITLDKALLDKVKRYADARGYSSVEEFITHVTRETDRAPRRGGLGGRDQEAAERARVPRRSHVRPQRVSGPRRRRPPVSLSGSSPAGGSRGRVADLRRSGCCRRARHIGPGAGSRPSNGRFRPASFEIRLFNDDVRAMLRRARRDGPAQPDVPAPVDGAGAVDGGAGRPPDRAVALPLRLRRASTSGSRRWSRRDVRNSSSAVARPARRRGRFGLKRRLCGSPRFGKRPGASRLNNPATTS